MDNSTMNQTGDLTLITTQPPAVGIQGFSLGPLYFGDFRNIRFPIYGIAWPIVAVLTTITSTLICGVLFRKSMRTPTNIVLGCIALANMMTCFVPVPVMLYLYWTEASSEWIQGGMCYAFKMTMIVAPVMFHNVSIWLTVLLALQQVIVVRYPLHGKNWITTKTTTMWVIILTLIAIFAHFVRCIDSTYKPVDLPSKLNPNVTITACEDIMHQWVYNPNIYFSIYFWLRSFLMHFVPCVMLVVLNGVLIHTMRLAYHERKRIMGSQKGRLDSQSQTNNRTTAMLITIVSVFLLVEIPVGILIILIVVPNTFGILLLPAELQYEVTTIADFLILCSYPFNFVIYSTMSRQFRNIFLKTFCKSCSKDSSLKYSSSNSNVGSRSTVVSRTDSTKN